MDNMVGEKERSVAKAKGEMGKGNYTKGHTHPIYLLELKRL